MNRWLVLCKQLACTGIIAFCHGSHAFTSEQEFTTVVTQYIDHMQNALVKHAESRGLTDTAAIIRQTKVKIDGTMDLPNIAFAVHEDQREILISGEFIQSLDTHLPTIFRSIPMDLTANALHTTELNSPPLNKAIDIPEQYQAYYFVAFLALTDVLLHEFGHHVQNAFYGYRASPFKVYLAEKEAEDWSVKTKSTLNLDEEELGKLIALSSALVAIQLKRAEKAQQERSSHLLKLKFDESCYRAHSQTAAYFCGSFEEAVADILGANGGL